MSSALLRDNPPIPHRVPAQSAQTPWVCLERLPRLRNSVSQANKQTATLCKQDKEKQALKWTILYLLHKVPLKLGMVIIVQVHILGNVYIQKEEEENKYVHFAQYITHTTI